MALRELLASFGVEVDDKQLRSFDTLLSKVTTGLTVFASAFAIKEIGSFVGAQIEAGFQLHRTAQMLGTSTDDLQAWRHSANMAGESTEKFDRAMRFLLKNQGKAEIGLKAGVDEFHRFGVNAKDADGKFVPLFDRVAEFSDVLVGMKTQSQRTRAAMAVFGIAGAQVLPWLLQGSKAVKEQLKDFKALGGGMSNEFVAGSEKAAVQLRRLKTGFTSLISSGLEKALPWIEKLAKKLAETAGAAAPIAKHIDALQAGLVLLAGSIGIVTIAMGGLQAVMMAGWFVLAVAGFALMALAADDLITTFRGGESVIRDTLTEAFGSEEAEKRIKAIQDAWDLVVGSLREAIGDPNLDLKTIFSDSVIASVWALEKALQGVAMAISTISKLVQTVKAAGGVLGNVASAFMDPETSGEKWATKIGRDFDKDMNGVIPSGSRLGDAIGERNPNRRLGANGKEMFDPNGRRAMIPYLEQPSTVQYPNFHPGRPFRDEGKDVVRDAHITINVNGAKDPKAVAHEVVKVQKDALGKQTQQAMARIKK